MSAGTAPVVGRPRPPPCGLPRPQQPHPILEHRHRPLPADTLGDHRRGHVRELLQQRPDRGSTASTIDPLHARPYMGGSSAANARLTVFFAGRCPNLGSVVKVAVAGRSTWTVWPLFDRRIHRRPTPSSAASTTSGGGTAPPPAPLQDRQVLPIRRCVARPADVAMTYWRHAL